jgi:hypothetical protein
MLQILASTTLEMPIGWLLGAIATLGGVIATLAATVFQILKARLDAQDKIIEHLRADVIRLTKGCGMESCHWRQR